jgi:hypothetical protein
MKARSFPSRRPRITALTSITGIRSARNRDQTSTFSDTVQSYFEDFLEQHGHMFVRRFLRGGRGHYYLIHLAAGTSRSVAHSAKGLESVRQALSFSRHDAAATGNAQFQSLSDAPCTLNEMVGGLWRTQLAGSRFEQG